MIWGFFVQQPWIARFAIILLDRLLDPGVLKSSDSASAHDPTPDVACVHHQHLQ
jgi:hypothetical protein